MIEVLNYADFLRSKLKHRTITEINVINGRYKKHGDFENLDQLKSQLPQAVTQIQTKGKFLYLQFHNGMYLFSTLGLSGGWLYMNNKNNVQFGHHLDYITDEQQDSYHKNAYNHRNVEFKLDDNTSIYYYDTLSFGTLKVITDEAHLNKKLSTLGPDISQQATTFPVFKERLEKAQPEKPVGTVLMNQRIVSGIGNYLRADVLWLSRISPFRKMKDLTSAEIKKLWLNSRLLTWSKYNYKKGLTNGFIEKDHPKIPEDYGRDFYVYSMSTDPQGRPVKKEELYDGSQKRFIYWSPQVQT